MTQFAKLYDDTPHGQILVKLDKDPEEGGPEVRFYAKFPAMGICTLAFGFGDDDDDGWRKAETAFEKVDEKMAIEMVKKLDGIWGDIGIELKA